MAIFVALFGCGCRNWQPAEEKLPQLPAARMRPDSIALEIAIANIELSKIDQLAQLWDALDEQGIAIDRRRILDANGIRCGIAAAQMPAVFCELVEASPTNGNPPPLMAHQLIQNGFGEVHPIEVSATVPQLHWSVIQADQSTRSGSCENATCYFELRTYPMGNGTAEIELCPKILHGAPRPKLSNENNAFTLRPLLDEIALAEVAFGCRLKPGETLILGPTNPSSGLGRIFLDGAPDGSGVARLILVRLARTQMDDLFSPKKLHSPLATSLR